MVDSVFIWIPKNAGHSVLNTLQVHPLTDLAQIFQHFDQKGATNFGHIDYPSLVSSGYVSEEFDASAWKYAIARNPYARAGSLYNYFQLKGGLDHNESFTDFCRMLCERGIEPIGLHNYRGFSQCNPQIRWVENVDLNYLGRVETLEEDIAVISDTIGGMLRVPKRKYNVSTFDSLLSLYTQEAKDIVDYLYEEDFRAFGYPKVLTAE